MQLKTAVKFGVELIVFLCLYAEVIIGTEVCSSDGDIRLAGGPNEFEGRLEYCLNSQWGLVCDSSLYSGYGVVACRQLGHSTSSPVPTSTSLQKYGAVSGLAHLDSVQCNGSEVRLDDCVSQNATNQTGCSVYTYLACRDPNCTPNRVGSVRLIGGTSPMTGRVEVCNQIGFRVEVCDNSWDDNDARVVCRELGWLQHDKDAMAITGYQLSTVRFSGHTSVNCSGDELYFRNCSSEPTRIFSTCTYAGVNCSGVGTSSVSPVPSSMTNLLASSTPTLSLIEITPTPVASYTFALSSSPVASTILASPSPPTEIPTNQSNTTLLAAVVGAVGGLIVLLLVLLVIVLIVFLSRRQKLLDKYNLPQQNNSTNKANLELKASNGNAMPRNGGVSDYDHILLNPLYNLKSQTNTVNLDPNLFEDENGYAKIKGDARKNSPPLNPKQFHGALDDGYSITVSELNESDVPLDDHLYQPLDSPNHLQAVVDEHGYSGLNTHIYDDVHDNRIPTPLEIKPSASPYEIPLVPPYESIDLIKRVEAYAEENRTDSLNGQTEPTPVVLSNQGDQHEYRTLEESQEPSAYEDSLVTPYESIDLVKKLEVYAEDNRTDSLNEETEPILVANSNQRDQHEYRTLEENQEPCTYEDPLLTSDEQNVGDEKVSAYENVESCQMK